MTKKKNQTAKTVKKSTSTRVRRTRRLLWRDRIMTAYEALSDAGSLRYNIGSFESAKRALVDAVQVIDALPSDWDPPKVAVKRKPTEEQVAKMKARLEKLKARIESL